MYKSLGIFSVSDERALRDPERIRALAAARHAGSWPGIIGLGVSGACLLALSAYGVCLKFMAAGARAGLDWTMLGVGFGFGLMLFLMAAAFYRELALCPLRGYLKAPQNFDFVKGRIVEATYRSDGSSGSRRTLVRGAYGERGLFIEEFDPGVWSDAVAERGEESLKPGDDRYDQKGKRERLPIEVWVIFSVDRGRAALAGIPADAAVLRKS